jgi:hypothetical protein
MERLDGILCPNGIGEEVHFIGVGECGAMFPDKLFEIYEDTRTKLIGCSLAAWKK